MTGPRCSCSSTVADLALATQGRLPVGRSPIRRPRRLGRAARLRPRAAHADRGRSSGRSSVAPAAISRRGSLTASIRSASWRSGVEAVHLPPWQRWGCGRSTQRPAGRPRQGRHVDQRRARPRAARLRALRQRRPAVRRCARAPALADPHAAGHERAAVYRGRRPRIRANPAQDRLLFKAWPDVSSRATFPCPASITSPSSTSRESAASPLFDAAMAMVARDGDRVRATRDCVTRDRVTRGQEAIAAPPSGLARSR